MQSALDSSTSKRWHPNSRDGSPLASNPPRPLVASFLLLTCVVRFTPTPKTFSYHHLFTIGTMHGNSFFYALYPYGQLFCALEQAGIDHLAALMFFIWGTGSSLSACSPIYIWSYSIMTSPIRLYSLGGAKRRSGMPHIVPWSR
jgi:energy-coupling factor transporter transmembrane protein EcfT